MRLKTCHNRAKSSRLGTFALSGLAMILMGSVASAPLMVPAIAQAEAKAEVQALKGVDFAQAYSQLPTDPSVIFGRLANGMGYILMKNATPAGTASVRLRFGAGSMMEAEDQRGLAHFIEHMTFRGSKNVGTNEFVKILERHGLKFGPDTNAFTSFDQTVYQLDLPRTDADYLETALFLIHETAANVTFDATAVDAERGVILGEERLRDSPDFRAYVDWAKTAFPGQAYAERLPIGKVEVIKTAPAQRLKDFYDAYYRPENATLIIVGDIDLAKVEARIKVVFSDWKPGMAPLPAFAAYSPKGELTHAYSEAGLGNSIQLSWFRPFDGSYQTATRVVEDFRRELALSILNQRLERAAKQADASFVSAQASRSTVELTAEVVGVGITPKPGKDKAALEDVYGLVHQYMQFGAQAGELDRALADMETALTAAAKGEKTRDTRELADQFAQQIEEKSLISAPSQDLDFFKSVKAQLSSGTVNESIKTIFSGDGPLITHAAADLAGLDGAALKADYASLKTASVTQAAEHAKKPWPYIDFGKPATVVKRNVVADLGVTQYVLSNGVKLSIKPTKFEDNRIRISVAYAGGRKTIAPADGAQAVIAGQVGLADGGLGKLDADEMRDSLSGKTWGLAVGFGEDSLTLGGTTTRDDFAIQMQVLMAFATDAAYRPVALARLKSDAPNFFAQLGATDQGVFALKGSAALYNNDPRYGFPSEAAIKAASNDKVKDLYEHALKTAPIDITIVGDISEDQALGLVEQTFGTLKPRPEVKAPVYGISFPVSDLEQVFEHAGRADQSLEFIAFPTQGFYKDRKTSRGLEMLGEVLTLRLTDEVRVKRALSYSPYAGSSPSATFDNYGYVATVAEIKPENHQIYHDILKAIIDDLKAHPISSDELLRARKPALDKLAAERKTNGYWEGVLSGSASDPRRLDNVRTREAQLLAITPDALQALARTYLDIDKALKIQVRPKATPATK